MQPGCQEAANLMATKTKPKKTSGSRGTRKAKSPAKRTAKAAAKPVDGAASAALAGKEALAGSRAAGKAVSAAAGGARVPLVAGGSLLAGLGGGLAVISRRRANRRRKRSGFDRGSALQAVQAVGAFGEEVGRIARTVAASADPDKR